MKRLSFTITGAILAVSLALTGCGGSGAQSASSASAADSTSAAQSTSSTPAAAEPTATAGSADKLVGTWKLAASESNGITTAGDFTSIYGTNEGMGLTVSADGTGALTYGTYNVDFTWQGKGDGGMTITLASQIAGLPDTTIDAVYDEANQAVVLTLAGTGVTQVSTFTADGTLASLPEYDLSKATPVTSIDQIAGDWKLHGMGMGGYVSFGEGDALNQIAGSQYYDPTLTINADGTAGTDGKVTATVTVGAQGATIEDHTVKTPANLLMLGDTLVIDMSDVLKTTYFMMYVR